MVVLNIWLGWVGLLFWLDWLGWVGDLSGFGNLFRLEICLG